MKKHNNTNTPLNSGELNFFGALQIAFIVLKLCGVVTWSWGWVLLPTWGGLLFSAAIVIAVFFVIGKMENKYTE